MEIQGKTVLITGANRGIGRAMAEALAKRGAHLILANRTSNLELENSLQEMGAPSVLGVHVDLKVRSSIDEMIATVEKKGQPVDVLINNAGLLTGGLLESQTLDEIYDLFQVNVTALVHLTRAFVPKMIARGTGKVVNHASVSAYMHFPGANTYSASKSAVAAFSESLRAELQGTGVGVLLLVTPGVDTDMYRDIPSKYGKNLNLNFLASVPPHVYGERVADAIARDADRLEPSGASGIGLSIAKHAPGFFQKLVGRGFHRD